MPERHTRGKSPTFRAVRERLGASWLEGMELRRCSCFFLSATHSCQLSAEPQRRWATRDTSAQPDRHRGGREGEETQNLCVWFAFAEQKRRGTTAVHTLAAEQDN